ncbi:MAG: carbon-nitrogen hydrolase family protein [Saprospiraceae bacterium]|nr:carbon-nitrogen hydrolase family protein [Saprospiraceae bacterium]
MKICIAQLQSFPADIEKNIVKHIGFIELAGLHQVDLIFFPELSLTGYEPSSAKNNALSEDNEQLSVFQALSDHYKMTISIGAPSCSNNHIYISNFIFQPFQNRLCYSKQFLHADEIPFFSIGLFPHFLKIDENVIAPAICYESMLFQHAEEAEKAHATIYMASVAKTTEGIQKAYIHYPLIAQKFGMTVVMSNAVGPCEGFTAGGNSGVWNEKGILADQLGPDHEALLIYDNITGETSKLMM